MNLPRIVAEVGRRGMSLDHHDVAPGGFVFFNMTSQPNPYTGAYVGQSRFVHAPAIGGMVRPEDMIKSYWANHHVGARCVVTVNDLSDPLAPTVSMTPASASPARLTDDDPLSTLARARDVQADSLMPTRGPATVAAPAEDDPIARLAT